jgi:signal transduction protein with GAF and PtsI domain
MLTLGKFLIFFKTTELQSQPCALSFKLNHLNTRVAFLQFGSNLMVSFANPQICELYDLMYPNSMVFALRSKSVQHLHITPRVSVQGFLEVYLGFLALLGFGCYQILLELMSHDHF